MINSFNKKIENHFMVIEVTFEKNKKMSVKERIALWDIFYTRNDFKKLTE